MSESVWILPERTVRLAAVIFLGLLRPRQENDLAAGGGKEKGKTVR